MSKPHIKYWAHPVFWLFIFFFIFDYHLYEGNWLEAVWFTLREMLTYAVIFYLNFRVLIPLFLEKNKKALYIISLLCTIILYVIGMRYSGLELLLYEFEGMRNVFSMVLNATLFLLVSTLFWYAEAWQIERERKLLLQNEKLETELKLLKAQISPHFIFNSLNNIYALALQKHDNAAPMVAKLSSLLRYVLYQSAKKSVPLKDEIEVLEDYFKLQKMRKLPSENIELSIKGNYENYETPPMLLVNLTENAFKHSGVESDANAWLKVESSLNEGVLRFSSQNSIRNQISKPKDGGFGLAYVETILEEHFPKKYEVKKNISETEYHLDLTINLAST